MRNIKFFGSILLLSFLIQAIVFNLEKVMYADAAFSVFRLLNEEVIPVEHGRFSGSIMHLPAYIGLKIGLGAGMLFKLFAMGQWLFFIGVFTVLLWLKKPVAALTLLVSLSGFMRESFFITTELPVALGFALLYHALLTYQCDDKRTRFLYFVGTSVAAIFTLYAHPAALVFLLFFILWAAIQQEIQSKWLLRHAAFLICLFAVRFVVFSSTGYEQNFWSQLTSFQSYLYNLRNAYSSQFFFQAYGGFYLPLIIMWAMSLRRLIMEVNKVPFYFILLGMPLLWSVIVHVFAAGDVNPMMEKNFLILVLPVVFVFFFQLYKQQGGVGGFLMVVVFIFGFWSLSKTMQSAEVYSSRLYHLDQLVANANTEHSDKFYTTKESFKKEHGEVWMVEWALPFETLLMSLNQSGKGSFVLSFKENSQLQWNPNRFYAVDFYYPHLIQKLNPRFFQLSQREWLPFEQ